MADTPTSEENNSESTDDKKSSNGVANSDELSTFYKSRKSLKEKNRRDQLNQLYQTLANLLGIDSETQNHSQILEEAKGYLNRITNRPTQRNKELRTKKSIKEKNRRDHLNKLYQSLADLLGVDSETQNRRQILEEARDYLKKHAKETN